MKAKITKPSGIIIEIEGTSEEIQSIIKSLEFKPTIPNMAPFNIPRDPYYIPSFYVVDDCTSPSGHEYPSPWFAIIPPSCKNCGKQASDMSPQYTLSVEDYNNSNSTAITITEAFKSSSKI